MCMGPTSPRGAAVSIASTATVGSASPSLASTTPNATLNGLAEPDSLVFDASGNLFVANGGGTTVSEFAPGATTPTETLTGVVEPDRLAFDGSGNLYVSSPGHSTVSEFAPGATTPEATLTGLNTPVGLAFDSSGDIFRRQRRYHHGQRVRAGRHHAHPHAHRVG